MDLVILAAGLGSRFGGLKQVTPVDEYNNFIIDYSIVDAAHAGFDRVIFIINKDNKEVFDSTIGSRIKSIIKVEYAFQEFDSPLIPKDRTKPMGTAQALLSVKDIVSDKFLIINSDDFYGRSAYEEAFNALNSIDSSSKNKYFNIAYKAKNTLSSNGSVKRGIINYENGLLKNLTESIIFKEGNKIYASPLDDKDNIREIDEDTLVSMNMFGFTKDFMNYLIDEYKVFLNTEDLSSKEYLLPEVVAKVVKEKKAVCEIRTTDSKWFGVTYKEDKEEVEQKIKELKSKGVYKETLY